MLVEVKRKRSSIRVAPSLGEPDLDRGGRRAAFGVPSASAQPSVNSSAVGGLTDVTRHQPCDVAPSGPVMK